MTKGPNILTLCFKCAELYKDSFSVKKYSFSKATTKPKNFCEQCKCKTGALEMYIVDKK